MSEETRGLTRPSNKMRMIHVIFGDGPLGVTLRRHNNGTVFVYGIVAGTQAENLDIEVNDELWSVGDSAIEDTPLDKDAWDGLVQYIKHASRPLKSTWVRKQTKANSYDNDGDDRHCRSPKVARPSFASPADAQQHHHDVDSENDDDDDEDDDDDDVEEEISLAIDLHAATSTSTQSVDDNPQDLGTSPSTRQSAASPTSEVADCDPDLIDLANRLVLKDKEQGGVAGVFSSFRRQPKTNDTTAASLFIKEGRKIVKSGELTTTSKGAIALFNAQSKLNFFLLTDILVVGTEKAVSGKKMYQVEDVIDLQACKIESDDGESAQFQVIWPGGTIHVSAKSAAEKAAWSGAIVETICGLKSRDTLGSHRSVGWKHQFVSGTLHAAVISRDEGKVRDILARQTDDSVVDMVDEDGYSALHYGCIYRSPGCVRLLRGAGADVTKRDRRGFTALHWAALQLDHESIGEWG